MNHETRNISASELTFLIGSFIQGAVIFISFADKLTKQDTWLAIIAGLMLSMPFALIYSALGKKFAGKTLADISELICGPYGGKFVTSLYVWYFWMLLGFNLKGFGDFLVFFMPETPKVFSITVFAMVCAYAVATGIEVLARLCFLFISVSSVLIVFSCLLLLKDAQLGNFYPMFVLPWKDFFHGIHIISVLPFGEIVVFLLIFPYVNCANSIRRSTLFGLLLGALSFLMIAVRNTAVLGNTEPIWSSPSLQAIRLINVGNILTRMDILIAIGHTIMLFVKCSILYYAVVASLSQMLRLRTYVPLIVPVGLISVTLSMIVYESTLDHNLSAQNTWPIVASLFVYVLPSLLLLSAVLRKLPNEEIRSGQLTETTARSPQER